MPQHQPQSDFMHDESFAAHDQHYEMQLPSSNHAYQSDRSGQLPVSQNSIASPCGSMQHVPKADSSRQHAGSSSTLWQQEDSEPAYVTTSASMLSSNFSRPPATPLHDTQSQPSLDYNSFQQLAEITTQHNKAQLRSSFSRQQTAQAAPQQQPLPSHSRNCTLQHEQPVKGAAIAAASPERVARQPLAPLQSATTLPGPVSRRLQARRTIYICDIDPKVCTHSFWLPLFVALLIA
jgi:hypothetical protein